MNIRIEGVVVSGKRVGRTIGFPTANIEPTGEYELPPRGVYAGEILIEGETEWRLCMVNHGMQPTIPSGKKTIEAYILDFDSNIYGKRVTIWFTRFLRHERKFSSVDELIEQLERDVLEVRV